MKLINIGKRIQEARLNVNLTQEQSAESLGVSRQTISNWENEKTYPDIISVIKMSDLYSISLDHLLKEEKPMSDYLNFLEESTDLVKSNDRLEKLILIISYILIWSSALIVYWFFTGPTDVMGYSLMFLWILLPVTTLVLSTIIGRNNFWGKLKWLSPIVFGLMYMLAEYATSSADYMAYQSRFIMPEFTMILNGAFVSIIGLIIGIVIKKTKYKKQTATLH